ncbi:SusC/RagA family TonB-linked outer membrane protein [Flavivirga eckloniae]|uniref:TonB-dependent receptor n=1 Tax=Flavivirga eckloniae TaxID=1803846 RepID=A0A2K9PRR5_9FLAO|nr:TonB-dependent receptor [Flavivirga eckloniae]AUP79763.1 TonB-dependent receptor [Flavivirga eckloniae]
MKMTFLKKLLCIFTFICSSTILSQTITGVVSDGTLPLPGASIIIKGTTIGTVTDFDGKYSISDVPKGAVLTAAYLGYIAKEVPVDGKSVINFVLEEDVQSLEEVVVVGYGTQKKSTITTSVSSVKAEDISEIPAADIGQTLQGRAAGVTVINSGSPGSRTAVRIRGLGTFGDGDPLYVVDGVFTNSINNINPSSIAKIDVLKDAAASAIYGSRGANGVIIITTKQGEIGKTTFSFSSYVGFQQSHKRYDLLNTDQYIQYIKEINAQTNGGTTVGTINDDPTFNGNGVDTDWQDELFRTALIRNYDFGANGGTKKAKYNFSFSAFDQDGIYIDTNFKRYTFNANSEAKLNDKFKVGETFALGYTETIAPQVSGGRVPLYNVIAASPYIPVRNPDGTFAGPREGDVNNSRNQIRVQETDDNLNRNTTLIGSLYAELELLKGLTLRTQFGLDANYSLQDNIARAFSTSGRFSQPNTVISKVRSNRVSTILTNTLNYNKSFGKHNLNLTLVSERQNTKTETMQGDLNTTLSSEIPELNNGIANSFTIPEKLVSYLGRINYDYKGKYLIQASIRRDKSSIFAPGNQVGWFPAGSVGWVVSREDFLSTNKTINNLKVRASYGVTGNNKINQNQSVNAFEGALSPNFNYSIDGKIATGVSINGANNFGLTWEEAIKQNYGFDLGLWNNKVTISTDYFINGSDGLIVGEGQAPSTGVPGDGQSGVVLFKNVGDIEVKGVEFTLGYNDYEGDFKWNVWANASTSKSEVTSLGKTDQIRLATFNPPFSERLSRLAPGEPLFHFYGYEFEGVYSDEQAIIDHLGADNLDSNSGQVYLPLPGDVRYKDINGDGDITEADKLVIGDPNPDFTYAASIKAEYKGFDLSMLITGVQGVDALNANIWFLQGQENVTNHGVEVLRRWQNPGDITDIPRFRFEGNNPNNFISTRYIQDASYARLRNITFGYSLSDKILNNTFNDLLSKARLYIQGQNLVTLTKYDGLDPEIAPFYGSSGLIEALNVDRGSAPQPQTVLIGLQLEF